MQEEQSLAPLLSALQYTFYSSELLQQALTHRSVANEGERDRSGDGATRAGHNEILEFLGDAVVDLVVSHRLMELLPDAREGELSKLRARVVSAPALAKASRSICLGDYLRLGRGEARTGGREKSSILSDAFEALMGAVYLDGGFDAARAVVARLLEELIHAAVAGELDHDHKTRLQETAQRRGAGLPLYDVVAESGPDHLKIFEVAVSLGDREVARASGYSKKDAEQRAADRALQVLAGVIE